MSKEKVYDERVAPLLLEAAKICEAEGLPMAAWVGFDAEKGSSGQTMAWPEGSWPIDGRREMIVGAMRARTIDDFAFAYARWVRRERLPHSSVVLRLLGVEPEVEERGP